MVTFEYHRSVTLSTKNYKLIIGLILKAYEDIAWDGGFGLQSTPKEIDTIADLQKIVPVMTSRGYSEADAAAILGGNWIETLRRSLPA